MDFFIVVIVQINSVSICISEYEFSTVKRYYVFHGWTPDKNVAWPAYWNLLLQRLRLVLIKYNKREIPLQPF